jgi:dipeptidase E
MNLLIVSTSTVFGQPYLSYLKDECLDFFAGAKNILFIPFARPGGLSHEDYTAKAREVFQSWGFEMRGAHEFETAAEGCRWADGFFTGGGNTFQLAKTLRESGYFDSIDKDVREGKPYMGTSAGCNMTGQSICTTNDMPIVYPSSFNAWGWVPFNMNPHYLDPVEGSTHMGETRETRIKEFHHFNDQPVVGLREGSWIRVHNEDYKLKGNQSARWFEKGKPPVEVSEILFL